MHGHSLMDGGYGSRKFWLAVMALFLLLVGALLGGPFPVLVGLYPIYSGSVVAVVGSYYAVNVAQKHLAGGAQARLLAATGAVSEPELVPGRAVE